MSNKRIRVVVAEDVIISSLPYVVPPQKENAKPLMIKKIHIVVDGTTMFASLPFVVYPMGDGSQRRVEDQLNNSICSSNDANNNYDHVTHQDSTSSSAILKNWLRPRTTKEKKTQLYDDNDSISSNNNNNNNGDQGNRKRKRSVYESEWKNHLLQLLDYKREFKNTNVPRQYAKNKSLARWVSNQRNQYKLSEEGKPSPLTKERIHSLNKLGFEWKIYDTWEDQLQQLVDFHNEFNHTNVPQQYTQNKPLGLWVKRQRCSYKLIEEGKPSALTKERIESLNKIGFVWRLHKRTQKATAPVVPLTAMSLLLSLGDDDDDDDDPSNETYTIGNNELCVVSPASASWEEEEEEKVLSVATIGCTSIAIAVAVAEEEEDGYESNESELYLII